MCAAAANVRARACTVGAGAHIRGLGEPSTGAAGWQSYTFRSRRGARDGEAAHAERVADVPTETRRELERRGASMKHVYRETRRGALARLRPGVYAEGEAWRAAGLEERHLALMRAAQNAARSRLVFSHESAAILHGIPLIGAPPERPRIVVPPGSARSSSLVQRTCRSSGDFDVVALGDLLATDLVTTAVDVAASRSTLGGVVAMSHVRRHAGVPPERIRERIDDRRPFRNARAAERALAESTAGSDSPLESLVMVRCADLGFEAPEQQRPIVVGAGEYRLDFAWRDGRIVLEADGREKYEDERILDGRDPHDVLWQEKLREDAIRARVDAFARTTWAEAWAGAPLAETLARLGVPRVRPARPLTR